MTKDEGMKKRLLAAAVAGAVMLSAGAQAVSYTHLYLETYPDTQYVDVLLTDLNGCFRGKRIPVAGLSKLEKGLSLIHI